MIQFIVKLHKYVLDSGEGGTRGIRKLSLGGEGKGAARAGGGTASRSKLTCSPIAEILLMI